MGPILVAHTGAWLNQKKGFKYSLRECRKDVEIHKANGLADALQVDKTKKSFWQKVNNKNRPHHHGRNLVGDTGNVSPHFSLRVLFGEVSKLKVTFVTFCVKRFSR